MSQHFPWREEHLEILIFAKIQYFCFYFVTVKQKGEAVYSKLVTLSIFAQYFTIYAMIETDKIKVFIDS